MFFDLLLTIIKISGFGLVVCFLAKDLETTKTISMYFFGSTLSYVLLYARLKKD